MLTLRQRGETWHARGTLYVNGRGVRVPEFSTHYKDREEAERFVREWELERHQEILGREQAARVAADTFRTTGRSDVLPSWARQIWKDAKKRAGQGGLLFDLGEREMAALVNRAGGKCEVSGIEFGTGRVSLSYHRPFMASLDRIDASRGYTFSNCRMVICAVNVGINQWGEEIFVAVCRAVARRNAHRGKRVARIAQTVPSRIVLRRSKARQNAPERQGAGSTE